MNKINPYPVTSTTEELNDINNKIINKEHFKKNINDEKLKTIDNNTSKSPKDKIECNICGRSYTRSNRIKHNKTKHHIFCVGLNKKWRESIIN